MGDGNLLNGLLAASVETWNSLDIRVVIITCILLLCTPLFWILFPHIKKRLKQARNAEKEKEIEPHIEETGTETVEEEEENDLPDEIYFEVFQYLEAHERDNLSLVSWKWKNIVEDSRLWISLYLSHSYLNLLFLILI